jgi:energy-coupling factor transporter ATP-binding protein EcfA2
MAALNKIIEWAKSELPAWQGDAVRRILLSEMLSETDENELYLMMKAYYGLTDDKQSTIQPVLPLESSISGASKQNEKIILKSITCIENVNALPNGSELPIGHEGVSIIYGENASGKSGFARILKRACNARDKHETVLKNVFQQTVSGNPKAKFKIKVGNSEDIFPEWQEGTASLSPHLSSIAVFDSKCARVIIDEKNEFQYKPYGTHVFEDLASLIEKLKSRLNSEKPNPEKPVIQNINPETTGYTFFSNLGTSESSTFLPQFKTFTKGEEDNLQKSKEFIEQYKKSNVDNKITSLKSTIRKYVDLVKELRKLEKATSTKDITKVIQIIDSLKAGQEAQEIAKKALSETEFPLKGVRTSAWRQLFESAEKYSQESAYPGLEYPFTEQDSRCVLCMQNLDESAKGRMKKFSDFIKDEVGTNLKNCTDKLKAAQKVLDKYHVRSKEEIANFITELVSHNNALADDLKTAYLNRSNIFSEVKQALQNETLLTIKKNSKYDAKKIFEWLREIKKEIIELEKAKVPEKLQEKIRDYYELASKKAIYDQIENINVYLSKMALSKKIQNCINTLDTRAISNKGRDIVSEECTPALQNSLKQELDFLTAHSLDIRFKPRGSKGVTLHEVEIAGAFIREIPSKVLSEGEQKAVAIAGFFAELNLSNHQCPIIFDDPVTSLDHKYRDKIAERIAKESLRRQIVVFTHDIAFLVDLEKHLGRLENAKLTVMTLNRINNIPGNIVSSKPWHVMSVKDRLSFLDKQIGTYSELYNYNFTTYNEKAAEWYSLFRETWEAIIEEIVFNDAIKRFGAEVQTSRLKEMEITDDDYKTIDIYMSKASEWMRGHDKSKALSNNRPSPQEIREDIAKTREFIKSFNKKKDSTRNRRNNLLNPQPTEVG